MGSVAALGKVGIIYSEGGVRGGIHMPLARAILERGITPAYLFGTSAGALSAAPIAEAHSRPEMLLGQSHAEKKWAEIDEAGPESVFDMCLRKAHFFRDGIFDDAQLFKLLDGFDSKKCLASPTQFDFGVFNHTRNRYEVLSNRSSLFTKAGGNPLWLRDAICASAHVTAIFPRVQVGNSWYSDGDFIRVMPAIYAGCDTIFALFCYPQHETTRGDLALHGFIQKLRMPWLMHLVHKYEVLRDRSQEELGIALQYVGQVPDQEVVARNLFQKIKSRLLNEGPRIIPVFPEAKDIPESYTQRKFKPGDIKKAQRNVRPRIEAILDSLLS